MRGADLLIKTLAKAGIKRVFSLSGNQIMPLYDACIDVDIEIIHTRHEAAAVYMAIAWSQLTGEVGVVMVTAAPGFANSLGPLYSAKASECPVLFLSGDAPVSKCGLGAFQELPQVSVTESLTKESFRNVCAERLGTQTARALRLAATGRPGPVHMSLPYDMLQTEIATTDLPMKRFFRPDAMYPSNKDVRKLLHAVEASRRPLVITGPAMNATRNGTILKELESVLAVPVVSMESPRGLKDPSLGNLPKNLKQADLILSLGKSIDFTLAFGAKEHFGENCNWIVVDSEETARSRAVLNLGSRLKHTVAADPLAMARCLSVDSVIPSKAHRQWAEEVADSIKLRNFRTQGPMPHDEITPAALCTAVQRHIDSSPRSVLICDGGEFGQWAQACLSGDERLINGPSGAIGGSLSFAIAAKLARPQATIFTLMGDGTIGFHFAEFETAVRLETPFVAIIGNDECWNAEHQIQLRDYGPDRLIGCKLSGARYDKAAEGLGGHGEYVTELSALDGALERAIASGKPACVNVEIKGAPAPVSAGH